MSVHKLTITLRSFSSQGQRVPDFDLATACTKKEGRKLAKMECMVNYHLARVPFWNGKDSEAMKNAERYARPQ